MITPHEPRRIRFLGVETFGARRLKTYAIRHGAGSVDRTRFAAVGPLVAATVPEPDPAAGRPGVGFAILHQGKTGDYFVLCWWDRENELPTRVWLREGDAWRPARSSESFCVWDLAVMWGEREAYVASVLSGRPGGLDDYLSRFIEGDA